jgi:hypothetical protein
MEVEGKGTKETDREGRRRDKRGDREG